jgi:hypothetical protein
MAGSSQLVTNPLLPLEHVGCVCPPFGQTGSGRAGAMAELDLVKPLTALTPGT